MTKTQTQLYARMRELVAQGTWDALPTNVGITVRWTRTVPTPGWAKDARRWPADTYNRLVFLTLQRSGVILGISSAPWMRRQDSHIPYWRAFEILDNPQAAFSPARRNRGAEADHG
jgi:hypothetical protein